MSDQIVYGGTILELDTASSATMSAFGNEVLAPAWSPSLIGAAGTAGKLRIAVKPDPPGVGNKWTFNFKKNGVTQFSVEISGTANTGYSASTFAVAAGDRLEIEVVPDSSPVAAYVGWCWTWTPTTADNTILCGTINDVQLSGTAAETICIAGASPGPRASNVSLRFPMAGTLTAQYAHLSTAPGVGNKSRTFYVRVDGVLQAALNVNIAGADTTGNATGASVAVADGQRVDILSRCIGVGDPAAAASYVSIGVAFTPAYPDFFLVGAYSPDALIIGSGTEYRKPSSGGSAMSWNSNYWTGFTVTDRVEIERMRVYLSALPTSGTYTVAPTGVHGPSLLFDSGTAQSQLAVMPKILNEGDDWATLYSAGGVGGVALSRASACYACRVPPDEGAPFTF